MTPPSVTPLSPSQQASGRTYFSGCVTGAGDKGPHVRRQRQAHHIPGVSGERCGLLTGLNVPQRTETTRPTVSQRRITHTTEHTTQQPTGVRRAKLQTPPQGNTR